MHVGILVTVSAYMEGTGNTLEQLTMQVPQESVFLDAVRGGRVCLEDNFDFSTLRCFGQRYYRQGV